jgi:hypothetical protein
MPLKATLKEVNVGPKFTTRIFTVVASGVYTQVAAGGETLDLSPAGIISTTEDGGKEYSGLPVVNPIVLTEPSGNYAEILDVTAVNASGVRALNNYVMKWYIPGGTELPGAAYPAGLLAPVGGNAIQVAMTHRTAH